MLDDACHSWTEMFLCHSIKISISLERLNQSSPFFHQCKGKFMTNLEIDIICSRFFLFLKHSYHPMIAFFMTYPVYHHGTTTYVIYWRNHRRWQHCWITFLSSGDNIIVENLCCLPKETSLLKLPLLFAEGSNISELPVLSTKSIITALYQCQVLKMSSQINFL